MGHLSRKPTSNEPPSDDYNPWGPQDGIRDDISVLLGEEGKRCTDCRRVILNEHIKKKRGKPFCPDCYKS
jgi:formamidopyrimidine-DNA glycosylase